MLRVTSVITDSNIGGAGTVLMTLLKNADREAFSHTVILPANSRLTRPIANLEVTEQLWEIPAIAEQSFSREGLAVLRVALRRVSPDLIHTHGSLSARVAARLMGIPVVATRHSVFDPDPRDTRFPRRQILGATNALLANRIIAVSPAAAKNLTDTGTPSRKITVVMNGAEPARRLNADERDEVRREYGIQDGEFVCAIIARLEEVKGHRTVIEAAKLLRDYPIKIIAAGTGSLEFDLRRLALDEGARNIDFVGFLPDVYKLENVMGVQLNASFGTEATSISLLEGMSLGVPAVVTDFGGNPYVIRDGENGIVVPTRDARALADAILKLYTDRELYARMSQNAERIYNESFTAERMTRDTERVYRQICRIK
jgi:glycosyltransferase involved in cell wall biosynthesis